MPQVEAPPQEERYYYASGRKIPLAPSTQFLAVKVPDAGGSNTAENSRVTNMLSSVAGPNQVLDLPQYGLKVVRVPDTGDAQVRSFMASQPGIAAGPRVYETPEAATRDQALIAIGEILVRFKPEIPEDQRRRL